MTRLLSAFVLASILLIGGFSESKALDGIFKPATPGHIVVYSGSASFSVTDALGSQTSIVRAVCSTACFLQFAPGGVTIAPKSSGLTSSVYLPANTPEYFQVSRGAKVSVIRLSTNGTLYLQEFSK